MTAAIRIRRPPATALGSALQALTLLIEQRLILDVAQAADRVDLRLLPPLCPLAVSAIDFRSARRLIDRAYAGSTAWLDAGNHELPHAERFLSMHTHRWAATGMGADEHRVSNARTADLRSGA